MFDDYAELRPLKETAEILANDADWPPLYNLEQLARNEVKVTAATYVSLQHSVMKADIHQSWQILR